MRYNGIGTIAISAGHRTRRNSSIIAGVILGCLSVVAVVLTQLNQPAAAATPPDTCFAFSGGTITDYYDNEGNDSNNPACPRDVDIPAQINGEVVTSIAPWTFQNRKLTSVTIPNSVVLIGNNAFAWNQITSIVIPSSVTTIDNRAFANNQLTSTTIPASVTTIGDNAFADNQLTSVTIPNSVTSIDDYAFAGNQLTTVTLPSSMTTIPNGLFAENKLTSITIPASVTTIGDNAFAGNQLSSVVVPASVTSIGRSAFVQNQLSEVVIQGNPALVDMVFAMQGAVIVRQSSGEGDPGVGDFSQLIVTAIYTPNMTTPPENSLLRESDFGVDMNDDGKQDTIISAYIVNPSPLTVRYQDTQGKMLRPSAVMWGNSISNQRAATLASAYPDATSADLANIYFTQGGTTTQTAPAIAGYTTPRPQTHTFTAGANTLTFVYTPAPNDDGNDDSNGGGAGNSTNDGDTAAKPGDTTIARSKDGALADTGVNVGVVIAAAIGLLVLGVLAVVIRKARMARR